MCGTFVHENREGPLLPVRVVCGRAAWYGSRTSGCDLREDMAVAPVRRGAAAS